MQHSAKSKAYSICSDVFNSVYGVRPRFDYEKYSLEELNTMVHDMSNEAEAQAEEDAVNEEQCYQNLLSKIKEVQAMCNCSPKEAVHYLMDDEGCPRYDYDYFCFVWNIPHNKTNEIKNL